MNRAVTFLGGVCVGAGLGMLFAPKSGERTRSLIRKRANCSAARLLKRSGSVHDTATETIWDGTRKIIKGIKVALA